MASKVLHKLSVRIVDEPDAIPIRKKRFYTVGEVALMLRVTDRTVRSWIYQGKLRAVTFGKNGPVRVRGYSLVSFLLPYNAKNPTKKKVGIRPRRVRLRITRKAKRPNRQSHEAQHEASDPKRER
jgi:excisionase family DNA binding protein